MAVIKSSIEPAAKYYWSLYSNIKIQRQETKWITIKMAYYVLYISNHHLENLIEKRDSIHNRKGRKKEEGQRREEGRNQNPYSLMAGMLNGAATVENSLAVLQ